MLNSIKYVRVCSKHALETLLPKVQAGTSNLRVSDSSKQEINYHLSIMLLNMSWKRQHSSQYLRNS